MEEVRKGSSRTEEGVSRECWAPEEGRDMHSSSEPASDMMTLLNVCCVSDSWDPFLCSPKDRLCLPSSVEGLAEVRDRVAWGQSLLQFKHEAVSEIEDSPLSHWRDRWSATKSTTALPGDRSAVPSTHITQLTTACNFSSGGSDGFFWPCGNLSALCSVALCPC